MFQYQNLTDEQKEFIDFAVEGKNILCEACIGSGKTTAIQVLCNVFEEKMPEKKILYLTYNKALKMDAKRKIQNEKVEVQNYDGYAWKCIKYTTGISVGSAHIIDNFFELGAECEDTIDVLILDEYQDISSDIAKFLEFIKSRNPKMQILAVGDMCQKLYNTSSLNPNEFIKGFMNDPYLMEFSTCFRINRDLANELGKAWGKRINGVNKNCRMQRMSYADALKFAIDLNPKDLLVLGSKTGQQIEFLNDLESKAPEKFNKGTVYVQTQNDGDRVDIGEQDIAIFTTYDASKGLERNTCILFDFTKKYWETRVKIADNEDILKNIFCVAKSRGKNNIILVQKSGYKIDSELNLSTLPRAVDKIIPKEFLVSSMFDYKTTEEIKYCMQFLNIEKVTEAEEDGISVKSSDELIDLSPCIGTWVEADYFTKYDIDKDIKFLSEDIKNKKTIHDIGYFFEDPTVEQKILYMTYLSTRQERYCSQIKSLPLTKSDTEKIRERLSTQFRETETVQQSRILSFSDSMLKPFKIYGCCDVVKNGSIWELKFTTGLKYEHYLQCGVYMYMFGLMNGFLWNVKTNERYKITFKNRNMFIKAVTRTVTRGEVTSPYDIKLIAE